MLLIVIIKIRPERSPSKQMDTRYNETRIHGYTAEQSRAIVMKQFFPIVIEKYGQSDKKQSDYGQTDRPIDIVNYRVSPIDVREGAS